MNLIWRLFTESREFFATMSNCKDLDSNILLFTNLESTPNIIVHYQPIRREDLPLALIPTQHGKHKKKGKKNSRNVNHLDHQRDNGHMENQREQQGRNAHRYGQQRHIMYGRQFYYSILK